MQPCTIASCVGGICSIRPHSVHCAVVLIFVCWSVTLYKKPMVNNQLRQISHRFPKSLVEFHNYCILCFNGHFPSGPGLADTRMSPFWILLELRIMEVVVTIAAIRRAKLQSNHHHQQTNTQLFTGRMPFLSPNEQYHST